jgi:hypothetical protein
LGGRSLLDSYNQKIDATNNNNNNNNSYGLLDKDGEVFGVRDSQPIRLKHAKIKDYIRALTVTAPSPRRLIKEFLAFPSAPSTQTLIHEFLAANPPRDGAGSLEAAEVAAEVATAEAAAAATAAAEAVKAETTTAASHAPFLAPTAEVAAAVVVAAEVAKAEAQQQQQYALQRLVFFAVSGGTNGQPQHDPPPAINPRCDDLPDATLRGQLDESIIGLNAPKTQGGPLHKSENLDGYGRDTLGNIDQTLTQVSLTSTGGSLLESLLRLERETEAIAVGLRDELGKGVAAGCTAGANFTKLTNFTKMSGQAPSQNSSGFVQTLPDSGQTLSERWDAGGNSGSNCSLLESLLLMDDMRATLLEETSLLSIGRLKVASSQCLGAVSVYNQAYHRLKFFTAPWLALADDATPAHYSNAAFVMGKHGLKFFAVAGWHGTGRGCDAYNSFDAVYTAEVRHEKAEKARVVEKAMAAWQQLQLERETEATTLGLMLDDELLEDADQTCERYPEIEDVESPIPASPSFNPTLSPTDFDNSLDETVSGGPTSAAIARVLDLNDSWGQSFSPEAPASGEDLLPPRGGPAFTTAGLGLCENMDNTPTTHQSWYDECHYEPLL